MKFSHEDPLYEPSKAGFTDYIDFDETPVFACGGSLTDDQSAVVIRRDANDGSTHRLSLPTGSSEQVDALVEACQPATFGLQGHNVLDKSYRDAVKLETGAFSSSLHPYDLGIIFSLAQLLWTDLPRNVPWDRRREYDTEEIGPSRVRSELYKLNVYSAPSGHFKPHVDTPRDAKQFGSLVICLPSPHEGGDLVVRHGTKSTTFKWDSQSTTRVQWAAFYSDCEHEVLPVTSGHRVTLTYNLFDVGEREKDLTPAVQVGLPDPESLQLFHVITALLTLKSFLRRGGTIGVHLSHFYAHHTDHCTLKFPLSTLKGIDLALYNVFIRMGFGGRICPILLLDEKFEEIESKRDCDTTDSDTSLDENEAETSDESGAESDNEVDEADEEITDDNYLDYRAELQFEKERLGKAERKGPRRVGQKSFVAEQFGPPDYGGNTDRMDTPELLDDILGSTGGRTEHIEWMNKPQRHELALTYLGYGNEPSIETEYSSAALLVEIPGYKERTRLLAVHCSPPVEHDSAPEEVAVQAEPVQPLPSTEDEGSVPIEHAPEPVEAEGEHGDDDGGEDQARPRKRTRC